MPGQDHAVTLRIFEATGTYPSYIVQTPRHLLAADEQVAWSVIKDEHFRREETAWLSPEEIRLFAAASLVHSQPSVNTRLYLHSWTLAIPIGDIAGNLDLTSDEGVAFTRDLAVAELQRREFIGAPQDGAHPTYSLASLGTAEEVVRLIDAIDVSDELLIRGLSKLLSASYLYILPPFAEEAGLAGLIAIEAALQFIRLHLELVTRRPASMTQVFDHVREAFPTGEPLADYLEELYDTRIIMVHPASRFGEFWAPPTAIEECWDAMHIAVYLFRYILLGEVWTPPADT